MIEQPLFRFAVVADSHVNPSDIDEISPFASHRLTNTRLRHTITALNAAAPDFVVHVGDMVHPVPEAVSYPQAVQMFREATAALRAPLHLVPGNHDTGDKCADYVPAGSIEEAYAERYETHFGKHFYSFDAHDCHFIVINTSLINAAMPREAAQAAWLEADLAANAGRRCFLMMHYPPYVASADEPGHYDNIDEPGRSWLLALLARHQVRTVFTGHVHNFFFNRYGNTDIFLMPSTAFVRADYAEMFRVTQPSGHENGRNDDAKLGFMLVDVYPQAVVPRFVRTFDDARAGDAGSQRDWPALPARLARAPRLGIDLRQGWTELHDIPYSSMLDEFRRKKARNDYPILALWEMGIRNLRVPMDDLLDPATRARMSALRQQGIYFTVFHFGWPHESSLEVAQAHAHLLDGIELVLKWPLPEDAPERLASLRERLGVPVAISRFWSAAGGSRDGKQIKLLVDHGFQGPQDPHLPDAAALGPGVDRLVFRVSHQTPAHVGIAQAMQACAERGLRAHVHVRLASDTPALAELHAWRNAMRALQAAFCAQALPEATIYLDTLADVDRGYFPRAGLIDRLGNPRLGSRVIRNLHGSLSEWPALQPCSWTSVPGGLVGRARCGDGAAILVIPEDEQSTVTLSSTLAGEILRGTNLVDGKSLTFAKTSPELSGNVTAFTEPVLLFVVDRP